MAEYIAIPKLGMSMTEATLVEWRVKEGDQVEKGDIVLLIETEKTQWEVEAAEKGFVHILVEQTVVAPVGRVVGLIAGDKKELETLQKEPAREIFTTVPEITEAPPAEVAPAPRVRASGEERVRISPVARKMAEEHMIDVTTIKGSGPDGRIIREDIEKAIEAKKKAPPPAEVVEFKRVKATIPLKGMRRAIGEHMHRSLSISAQLTSMGEIDMAEVVKFRASFLEQEQAINARITYTDILVLAIAHALKQHPNINASLVGNEIKIWEDINIGVAVALEQDGQWGLIVPVVRNADKKTLIEINREVRELTEKARTGKLMPDDVAGSTFTLTNLGAFGGGWGFGTPIINQPESAILGTGPITDRPVVRDGQIVIRPVMTYSFTFDHRVIDGAPAALFMVYLSKLLESPSLLLL
jgi:pyruvate dehydrogenase E2 component (dihydrolipoamide acetyltransferase)/2-oxoglutarate dehydrogenase E2 component (dihydrolipoamide succinyltransferase)